MSTYDWFLIGWWILGAFLLIAGIGKPKKPTEPLAAAFGVAIIGGLAVGLLVSRGAL